MVWTPIRSALKAAPTRSASPPTAAVALLVTEGLDVLLIRRALHPEDPWSGQMALPGGRRESGDADPRATAVRETLEETGIRLAAEECLGELDDLEPRTKSLPPVIVRPFVFGVKRKPRVAPSPEVAGHLWVGLSALREAAGKSVVEHRGKPLSVDAFLVCEPPVWGMTHRILSGLLRRL